MTLRLWRIPGPAGLAIAALAAACQPLPHPFGEDWPPAALVAVPDSVNIAVDPFAGEPHATTAKLPMAVAHALVRHNIPASDETTSRTSYHLDGWIEERPDQAGKSVLTVFWRLRDAAGKIINQRSDRLSAPTRDWDAGGDEPIAQLADAGAIGLAALFAEATPKEQPGGGRTRVAIGKIAGAPGDGDASLAASLTALLRHQDIALVDAAQGTPDLAVEGEVAVGAVKEGRQHVKIVWRVVRAGGGQVGTVAQENDVPRGQLDGAWGDVAYSVAMAAEEGIMQLVDRGGAQHKPHVETTAATQPLATPNPGGATAPPVGPPVAGNIAAPEVNLSPVNVAPSPATMPTPLATEDVPVLLPYRGVPLFPH